jgi:hypothetical protein
MHKIFQASYLKERDYLGNLSVEGRRILKRAMNKYDAIMGAAFICLRLMTRDGLL